VTWALVLLEVALWLVNSLLRQHRRQEHTGAVGWTLPEVLTWLGIAAVGFVLVSMLVVNDLLSD
jgi:hypothetical protein